MGRSGTLDVLKLKVITLSHGKGGTVINASMVNQELAQLRKKWEDLSKDTQMRYVHEREMKIVEEKEVRVNNIFLLLDSQIWRRHAQNDRMSLTYCHVVRIG